MKIVRVNIILAVLIIFAMFATSGCTRVSFYKRTPEDVEKIKDLSERIKQLQAQREKELKELQSTKELFEKRLQDEIKNKEVALRLGKEGLTLTFLAEVFFDSGKAQLKPHAEEILDKVAAVINQRESDKNIGIQGHTDNQPIKYSGWKSNWELSSTRALSVLHYLEKKGVDSEMMSAIGYGEYRPVASNASKEGRQENRRVEITIIPMFSKVELEALK